MNNGEIDLLLIPHDRVSLVRFTYVTNLCKEGCWSISDHHWNVDRIAKYISTGGCNDAYFSLDEFDGDLLSSIEELDKKLTKTVVLDTRSFLNFLRVNDLSPSNTYYPVKLSFKELRSYITVSNGYDELEYEITNLLRPLFNDETHIHVDLSRLSRALRKFSSNNRAILNIAGPDWPLRIDFINYLRRKLRVYIAPVEQ